MTERTPVTPEPRDAADPAANQPTTPYPASPAGWGAAPTPTSTATLDAPAPTSTPPAGPWDPGAPNGATPWYGSAATPRRKRGLRTDGPRPPWFWQVLAVGVGLAALLIGGGIGFAIGHSIGGGTSQSTTQVPGTNQFPGGGTGQFPGNGTRGGTDGGSDTGSGSDGSSSNG